MDPPAEPETKVSYRDEKSPQTVSWRLHARILIWLDQSSKFWIVACRGLKSREGEGAQLRRWIILIFAGWLPHDMDPSGAASA